MVIDEEWTDSNRNGLNGIVIVAKFIRSLCQR